MATKFKEFKQKTILELNNLLNEKKVELGHLRFQLQDKQLKNVNKIKETKRDVARIKTLLSNKDVKLVQK
ncbi:MAG: 50S ribosomal protein L29 [Parcubacteria group bacterium]|nr:50S ribosomal protein L29 [Parcubacteria group bacterium]